MKNCQGACLSVLGNELRLSIFKLLAEKPLTVQQICRRLRREQSAVSHALKQLKECGFVESKTKGKEREYFVKAEVFTRKKTLFEMLKEHSEKCNKR